MTTIMAKLHFKGFASETTLYFIHSYLNNVLEILRSLLSKGNLPNSWSHLILVCETGPKCVFKRGYTHKHILSLGMTLREVFAELDCRYSIHAVSEFLKNCGVHSSFEILYLLYTA